MLLPILLLLNLNTEIYGASNSKNKVIMIIINRIDFHDLYSMPYVHNLINNSSIGLMNTRASGGNNDFKSYATLGWGIRAEATKDTAIFYPIDYKNLPIYERRQGNIGEVRGLINLDISPLTKQNIKGEYGAIPGALGNALKEHGYKTVLIGNSDTDVALFREAGLIAMNSEGYINYGNVGGDLLEKNPHKPFGIRTNYNSLYKDFLKFYLKGNFIVIETGDINRLEHYKANLTDEMFYQHKQQTLKDIDDFIHRIVDAINFKDTTLMIVTPYPSDSAASKGERLTPIVVYDGGANKGLLWSATTRRQGIVANIDIAPTVLSYFNLPPDGMVGKPVETVSASNNMEFIHKLNKRVVNTSVQRYRVLYKFAVFQMIASVLALLAIIFRQKVHDKWYRLISLILLGTIVAPFTLLILPLFGTLTIVQNYILLIAITSMLVLMLYIVGKKQPLNIISYSCFLLSFSLLIDILLGQNLIKNSILGYDPIIGARYYGIGNEYMGVLIGSVLIFTSAVMDKYDINKYFAAVIYLFATITIALPSLGANVGGTITAVFAFLFTFFRLSNKRINLKSLTYIVISVIMVIVTIAAIDLLLMENKSHLATAIQQILFSGPIVIYEIIVRKVTMNLRVMGVTVWSRVLLSAIVVLAVLFYRPVGILKKITTKYPSMAIGWSGIIVACIVSFVVNDSGVVSAATTVMFLTTTILYLIMDLLNVSNE